MDFEGVAGRAAGGLVDDFEAIFFNYRVGQHFFGDALDLLLGLVAIQAIEIQDEEFALADVFYLAVTEAGQGVMDGLALGIEHGTFWHNPDVSFHRGIIHRKNVHRERRKPEASRAFWREAAQGVSA